MKRTVIAAVVLALLGGTAAFLFTGNA